MIKTEIRRWIEVLQKQGMAVFLHKTMQNLHHMLRLPSYIAKTRAQKPATDIDTLINFVSAGLPGVFRLYQVKSEIKSFLSIVAHTKPINILEIGTAGGGTLFLLSRVVSPDAFIISLDLPKGPFGGGYPFWKIPLYKSFAAKPQKIRIIRADSHSRDARKRIKAILRDRPLDLLLIDGDHSYEGVKKDFEMYMPFVKKGGLIAFHDIVRHPPESGCDVHTFWNEIKAQYKQHQEIVENWNQGWCGIGAIYK